MRRIGARHLPRKGASRAAIASAILIDGARRAKHLGREHAHRQSTPTRLHQTHGRSSASSIVPKTTGDERNEREESKPSTAAA